VDLLLLQVLEQGADVDEARQQPLQDGRCGQQLIDCRHHFGRQLDHVHAAFAAVDVVLEEGERGSSGRDHGATVVEALDQAPLVEKDHAAGCLAGQPQVSGKAVATQRAQQFGEIDERGLERLVDQLAHR